MFVKDKTYVTSRVSGIESAILYLGYCCLSPMRRNSVLEVLSVSHPGGDVL